MKTRLKKIQLQLEQNKVDALLVIDDINVSYLTHINASESWLLVTAKKAYYITDFRYIHEVSAILPKGIKPIQHKGSVYDTLYQIVEKDGISVLGFDEVHWNVLRYKLLRKLCPKSVKLKVCNHAVESLREIKEESEIAIIREGLKIHDQALKYLKKFIVPGATEREVFKKLEQFAWRKDVGFSFPPILAGGPNSSFPHASVTTRKIRNNEPVLLDMGIDLKGYKTDLTRMFFLGKISNLVSDINKHVYEAQQRAIQKIQAGVEIASVDLEARKYLKSQKLDKYFGHALGHGVGLEIHESPGIYRNNKNPLRAGMVITVEPAVYLPNQFGIRLEEMVLVKEKGCEVISGHIN